MKRRKQQAPIVLDSVEALAAVDVAEVTYEKECVEIEGIVYPSSGSGWPRENCDYDVHCFQFAAWRRPGQALNKRKLTILRPVAKESNYFDDFPDYSIHRIRLLLSTDETRAVFDRLLPPGEPDEELLAFGEELRKPVIISTQVFGDLVLDRQLDWFEGSAMWNGEDITIHFHTDETQADESLSIDTALKTAEVLWANQAEWNRKAGDCAVEELLELKNDTWLQDDETPLSKEDFIERMVLESITFNRDGSFDFWHDDGDMFWGHSIEVAGNLRDGIKYANIAG